MIPELAGWYADEAPSILLAYVWPAATAGLSTIYYALRARREGRRAIDARRAADEESATLDAGDTILRGRVAYAQGEDSAMRVTVEQHGLEAESSGSWTVTWTEMNRTVRVAPFYVVHASGERVRVEPGRDAKLASALVATERVSRHERKRIAEIAPDEEVWVTGVLGKEHDPERPGGYRDGRGWVMRPARGDDMVVSTLLPERTFLKRRRHARVFGFVLALMFALMMLVQLRFHALLFSGVPASCVIADKITLVDDDNHESGNRFDVRATHAGGARINDSWLVTAASFESARQGDVVPCIASFGPIRTTLPGDRPRAHIVTTLVASLPWLVLALVAYGMGRRKEWYEGAAVVESYSGRLEEKKK